jgi:hypothetical protein
VLISLKYSLFKRIKKGFLYQIQSRCDDLFISSISVTGSPQRIY